ncbi:MAG: hypothetical protein HY231_06895 [Acidobacteria bacterium]|nr:hypothetical protein [Acidobacteriota bacterium]
MKQFLQCATFFAARAKSLKSLPMLLAVLVCYLFLGAGAASAAVYQVGVGKPYTTIASLPALNPGDVVEIYPGTYNEVRKWTTSGTAGNPITIRGMGSPRPLIDANKKNISGSNGNPRAIWQIEGSYYVIENLEFINGRNGNNGAGIRLLSASSHTIRNCKITYCDMGMMSDNNTDLLVDRCEIAFNGTRKYNGFSHNFYLNGNKATVQFCYIHDALYGQNFKTRGHYTELLYNYIADSNEGEVGPVDGTDTTTPNSNMVMIGNLVISKPNRTGNTSKFIDFGADSGGVHNGTLYLVNNTLIAGSSAIAFLSASATDARIVAENNVFYGSNTIASAATAARISGDTNWIPASAVVPSGFSNSLSGADPGFVNAAQRNYHLTSAAACRNVGLNAPVYYDGSGVLHSAVPLFEYVEHLNSVARASDGSLDIGAFEYGTVAANQPPVVTAGPDQIASLRSPAVLQGEVTDDGLPEPSALTVAWSVISGPGTGSFLSPNTPTTMATFSAKGTYLLRLMASDGELSSFAEVTVKVKRK